MSRKTFSSIRVRGPVLFESSLSHKGVDIPVRRRFVALVTQTGALAPTSVVVENSLNGVPAFVRDETGVYRIVLAGAFPEEADKIFAPPVAYYADDQVRIIQFEAIDTNSLHMTCVNADGSSVDLAATRLPIVFEILP